MIYAISDLHGCYERYLKMLEKINFCENDTLYILGDVVDRGDGGIKLLKDIMKRKNVCVIKGNHDYLAYKLLKISSQPSDMYDADKVPEMFRMWAYDGGTPTYEAFLELSPEEQKLVLAFLDSFLIYEEITAGDKKYFLAHTVPEKKKMQDFDRVNWSEFIMGEPEYEKEYFTDKIIVTGHTPTGFIDPESKGRIWQGNNHIAIDCGAVFGNPLGCICLDTLEEFYVE